MLERNQEWLEHTKERFENQETRRLFLEGTLPFILHIFLDKKRLKNAPTTRERKLTERLKKC